MEEGPGKVKEAEVEPISVGEASMSLHSWRDGVLVMTYGEGWLVVQGGLFCRDRQTLAHASSPFGTAIY